MSRFFIDRPVFAWAIAIAIMISGIVALTTLPVEQYPRVAPPTITIAASYPGAAAKTVEDSVTQIIEQKLAGLDYLRYIESTSDSMGGASITLTFDSAANPDIAQVQVQNKVQTATPLLPQAVQSQGITVRKASGNMLLVMAVYSDDPSLTGDDINDYVFSNLQDPISRVQGVGDVMSFGSQYAMRIWFDPYKLVQYNMSAVDATAAIRAQNAQVSAGSLGAMPAVAGQRLDVSITTRGRLQTAEQFGAIVVRVQPDGSRVHLRDIARVELGRETYSSFSRFNGKPASGLGIMPAEGANALETVTAVKAKVDELSAFFPKGMKVAYTIDTTPFVTHSITEVVKTIIEAMFLVFLVMYLFLGSIRATLIPTLAIPVVLLGTFGVLAATGFTLNTLTLFGMVLAIGLLVDDAIIVVENVERVMEEDGLPPREATRKSMGQISSALVGVGLVLCAAFVPMAFFGNSSGVIYRQFSITVATSVALSVIVALIFSPALCASLLKPVSKTGAHGRCGFFGWFNRTFNRGADRYAGLVQFVLGRGARITAICGLLAVPLVALMYKNLPTGFLPDEDKAFMMGMAQLPPGATIEQSQEVADKMQNALLGEMSDSVDAVLTVTGFSYAGNGQNQVAAFIKLKDWAERKDPGQSATEVQGRAFRAFSKIREATAFAMIPAPIQELANTSGFDFRLVDNAGVGHDALVAAQKQLITLAAQHPALRAVRSATLDDKAELRLDIDFEKASALGISADTINTELSRLLGGAYIDDFVDRGRVKRVYIQGDASDRMQPEDLNRWHVRNSSGDMVPLSAFTNTQWQSGSPKLTRFNGVASLAISGEASPGYSTGEAMAAMEELTQQLPSGITYAWAGSSYEEKLSG
ncbi:MAG: efflux RND transporter permease subunit, partial [Puniceicoccales bacterium]|nr:efflux RND transporter permease subunit [Puniceicoccales bacterium]